jgi:hypothetical protein
MLFIVLLIPLAIHKLAPTIAQARSLQVETRVGVLTNLVYLVS